MVSKILTVTVPNDPVQVIEVLVPGQAGPQGEDGPPGPPDLISIGTVTTGAAGSQAVATISGATPNRKLNLTIPKGDQGIQGPPNTLSIGTVSNAPIGGNASATLTGTSPNQVLNLVIPRGDSNIINVAAGDQRPAATAGSLIRRLGSYQNLVTNPRGITPDTTVITQRTNLATNPSMETGITGYAGLNATISATTEWAAVGTQSLKVTPGGANADSFAHMVGSGYTTMPSGFVAGKTYTISATGRNTMVQAAADVNLGRKIIVYSWAAGNVGNGQAASAAIPNTAGAVARVSATITLPADTVGVMVRFYSGSSAAAETVLWDAVLVEEGATAGDYFDGDTTDTKTIDYAWTGTAHASTSTVKSAYYEARRNLSTNPRGTVNGGGFSPNNNFWTATFNQAVPAPHPLGITTAVKSTVTNAASATNTLVSFYNIDGQFASTVSRGSGVWVYAPYAATAQVNLGATIPVPANTWTWVAGPLVASWTSLYVFKASGSVADGDVAYVTGVISEVGMTPTSFFDGATTDADPSVYEWIGSANASVSVQRTRRPSGWSIVESSPQTVINQRVFEDGSRGVRVLIPANASAATYRLLWVPLPGNSVVGTTTAGTNISLPMRIRSYVANTRSTTIQSSSGTGGTGGAVAVSFNTGWKDSVFRYAATQAATSNGAGIYLNLPTDSSTTDRWWDFSALGAIIDTYDGPFFDGDTGPSDWNGVPNNSTSSLRAPSVAYWDGTNETWYNDETHNSARTRAIQADLDAATSADTGHGQLVRRTAAGVADFKSVGIINAPTQNHHAARKDYVDALGTDLPTANTVVRRDAQGHISGKGIYGTRMYMSDPQQPDAYAATRKDYVDGKTWPVATISDSTTVGRSLVTAVDAAAARTAIGATATGSSVITAADAAAARAAIGAGTSSLAIGTTSATAKAGDYTPPDATTGAKGLIQLANHLGGTATAPTVRSASEAQTGIVELATAAETTTGTDNTRAVHPAGLKVELDKKATVAGGILKIEQITQAAYDALGTKVATTLYVIVG